MNEKNNVDKTNPLFKNNTTLELPKGWYLISFVDNQKLEKTLFFNPLLKILTLNPPFNLSDLFVLIKAHNFNLGNIFIEAMHKELEDLSNKIIKKTIIDEKTKVPIDKKDLENYFNDYKKKADACFPNINNDFIRKKRICLNKYTVKKDYEEENKEEDSLGYGDIENNGSNRDNTNGYNDYKHMSLFSNEIKDKFKFKTDIETLMDDINNEDNDDNNESNNSYASSDNSFFKEHKQTITSNKSNINSDFNDLKRKSKASSIVGTTKSNIKNNIINHNENELLAFSESPSTNIETMKVNNPNVLKYSHIISPYKLLMKLSQDSNLKLNFQFLNINCMMSEVNSVKCIISCKEFVWANSFAIKHDKEEAIKAASQIFLGKLFPDITWRQLVFNTIGKDLFKKNKNLDKINTE